MTGRYRTCVSLANASLRFTAASSRAPRVTASQTRSACNRDRCAASILNH